MKAKKQFRKLLNKLPSSINDVNEMLENEEVVWIEFMDGERITSIEIDDEQYTMMDGCCMEIDTVNVDRLKRNSLYS